MTAPSVGVLLVDDHRIVRAGLALLLEREAGVHVLGEADSGEAALARLDELMSGDAGSAPKVVLMDLMMSGIGGVEATRRIRAKWPEIAVLVLTMADDPAYLRAAFAAGASGYVLKDAADVELVEAIHAVAEGGRYLHPALGAELLRAEQQDHRRPGFGLSPREVEVLRLIALGHTNREIADALVISIRTVEAHKTNIMRKTGKRGRSQLVGVAREAGIV